MALSSSELLLAAQSDPDPKSPAWQELLPRFGELLRNNALFECQRRGLPLDDADDIVTETILLITNPKTVPFDPARSKSGSPTKYLKLLTWNATARRERFHMRAVPTKRHRFTDPVNASRGLPSSLATIPATFTTPSFETSELAAAILHEAGDLRPLLERVTMNDETHDAAARDLGVDRRTVGRRLHRFFVKMRQKHGGALLAG